MLQDYQFLQYIDLSCNKISDVTPLSGVKSLIHLALSNNLVETVLDFKPPYYLTYVCLRFNRITELRDLSEFWALRSLDVSHNRIERIYGVKNLK